jgi:AIG2-like family.
MFDRVWSRLVNGHYTAIPATLHGYQRLAVKDEEYPVAVAEPTATITGMLYLNISPDDIAQLDKFEGDYYTRLPTPVITIKGVIYPAETYILKPAYQHIATANTWDEEFFRTHGIEQFIARYQGFTKP